MASELIASVTKKLRFTITCLRALGTVLYVFTLGITSYRNREFIRQLIVGYSPFRPGGALPTIPLNSIVAGVSICLDELPGADGNVTIEELVTLGALASGKRDIFEIGTFDGRSTLNFALNCAGDGTVYTLDLPAAQVASAALRLERDDHVYTDKAVSGARFAARPEVARIVQLYGDSGNFDFSPYAGRMDLVFVDGSHSYEYVLHDSRTALKLVKPGGTIAWHDYDSTWFGVTRALNELHGGAPEYKGMRHIDGTKLVVLTVGEAAQPGRGRRIPARATS